MGRETPAFSFIVINRFSVNRYLENPVVAVNQFGLKSEFGLYRFRQTGGLWQVISLNAVSYTDIHLILLLIYSTVLKLRMRQHYSLI